MTSCLLCLCLTASIGLDVQPAVPPRPVEPAPVDPKAAPPPPSALPVCPLPISICDFCQSFKPAPGNYQVLFLHPVKKCPVWVCFTLPQGCGTPRVCCSKREIVFDYGCKAVAIQFKILCGRVAVYY